MTNDIKLKVYPAVIGVLSIGVLVLLFGRFDVSVWTETPLSDGVVLDPVPRPLSPPPERSQPTQTTPEVVTTVRATPEAPSTSSTVSGDSLAATHQGNLRVSNQTNYPLRVALLPQEATLLQMPNESKANSGEPSRDEATYSEPVHWDFAPGEGSTRGMILSLPESDLKLQNGDVLVVFAQDGSRRYWGPFVVGKTDAPFWNETTAEWQLVVQ